MPPAFPALVAAHRSEILRYVTRLVGHHADAEDVVQETWLRAQRAHARLPADANARAWLYRIATNRALTALRRRQRHAARTGAVELDGVAAPRAATAERREELRAVAEAVGRLPPKQRAALLQRRVHGLSYVEIADGLGCSPASARANVYQAVKKLRALLAARATR